MQQYSDAIRGEVWERLKQIYYHYTNGAEEITSQQIERIVVEVLREDTQRDLSYVLKNLFRLDVDNSGTISFVQFANFLLKRHCGQIALQKLHRQNQISRGSEHKINAREFNLLMNISYEFLQFHVDENATNQIFQEADKDRDGYITYVEYFSYIDKYLCFPKDNAPVKAEPKPMTLSFGSSNKQTEIKSRLRRFFWGELRELYEFYDKDGNGRLDTNEIEVLISEVLDMQTQSDLEYILFQVFQMKPNQDNSISYQIFAPFFLSHLAELGLNVFQENNSTNNRALTKEQFVILIRSSFSFLSISRVHETLWHKFFDKIDTNRDGLITFQEYLEWVNKFLCPQVCYAKQYYVLEDDENTKTASLISERREDPLYRLKSQKNTFVQPTPASDLLVNQTKPKVQSTTTYSNLNLARRVRKQVLSLIKQYDIDKNELFDEQEIITVLEGLFKENKHEVRYVIANVFRYDRNGDRKVTHDELADFFLEVHCGEMAIQRLHRANTYKRGSERLMDLQEFIKTINYALNFINITATQEELNVLFREIDTDRDGFINYREYFEFLRHYFGSLSQAAGDLNDEQASNVPPAPKPLKPNPFNISPEERFSRLIRTQSRVLFIEIDRNKNLIFEREQIDQIIRQVLRMVEPEAGYCLNNVFREDSNRSGVLNYEQLLGYLLEIYYGQVVLVRLHNEGAFQRGNQRLMSRDEFIHLINTASQYVAVKPDPETLPIIFQNIDTDKDGFISYRAYYQFIRIYLGLRRGADADVDLPSGINFNKVPGKQPQPQPKPSVTPSGGAEGPLENELLNEIYGELHQIFHKYDADGNGTLDKNQLEFLIREVLQETSKRELDYVFWNIFRFDPNADSKVNFQQFAVFILKHAAEISLQRFHAVQTKGKDRLSIEEFAHLVAKSYAFLPSIGRFTGAFEEIFRRLDSDRDGAVRYSEFIVWVNVTVSRKVR